MQARPIATTADGVPASLRAEWSLPGGVMQPSQALLDVTNAIMVTIFMALLATTIGTIFAAPLLVPGRRQHHPQGRARQRRLLPDPLGLQCRRARSSRWSWR